MRVKYVLKPNHKELVEDIRRIFGDAAIEDLEKQVKNCIDAHEIIRVDLSGYNCAFSFSKIFNLKDFDKEYEYSDDSWNHFPMIQPPVDIWMKCKYHASGTETYTFVAKYVIDSNTNQGKWINYERDEVMNVHSYILWNSDKENRKDINKIKTN